MLLDASGCCCCQGGSKCTHSRRGSDEPAALNRFFPLTVSTGYTRETLFLLISIQVVWAVIYLSASVICKTLQNNILVQLDYTVPASQSSGINESTGREYLLPFHDKGVYPSYKAFLAEMTTWTDGIFFFFCMKTSR